MTNEPSDSAVQFGGSYYQDFSANTQDLHLTTSNKPGHISADHMLQKNDSFKRDLVEEEFDEFEQKDEMQPQSPFQAMPR